MLNTKRKTGSEWANVNIDEWARREGRDHCSPLNIFVEDILAENRVRIFSGY